MHLLFYLLNMYFIIANLDISLSSHFFVAVKLSLGNLMQESLPYGCSNP